MNSLDWLSNRVLASPDKIALIIGETAWRYDQMDRLVNGVCQQLLALGVAPGHKVAVRMPNNLLFFCLIHAVARLGGVLVPLNGRLTPTELAWQLNHVGCSLLLTVADTAVELPHTAVRQVVLAETIDPTDQPPVSHPFSLQQAQAIVFTSGTSGQPKGVWLTFANHFYSAMASAYQLGVLPDDLWLSCLPLYHVGGLAVIWRSCLAGTAVDLHSRFDQTAVNDALDQKPVTLISLVPTMLHRLLQSRQQWPSQLRLILLGGAAAPAPLVQQANQLPRTNGAGPRPLVAPTYGLTETASQIATLRPEMAQHKPGSVGKPLLFSQIQVVDSHGRGQPIGEAGEIVVSGPTVMAGYYQPGQPMPATPPDSLATGDLGYLDEAGDLWVLQRRSDLIISGGENIYPIEVEAALKSHPAVVDACVVGVDDVEWGQTVAALVVLAEHTAVTADELLQFCRQRLAAYKQPRLIQFASALPLNGTGKVARTAVRQQLQRLKDETFV